MSIFYAKLSVAVVGLRVDTEVKRSSHSEGGHSLGEGRKKRDIN